MAQPVYTMEGATYIVSKLNLILTNFSCDVSNEVLLPEDVTSPRLFTQWKALLTSSLKFNLILTNFSCDVSNEVLLPEDVTSPRLFTQWKALLTSSLKFNLILTILVVMCQMRYYCLKTSHRPACLHNGRHYLHRL